MSNSSIEESGGNFDFFFLGGFLDVKSCFLDSLKIWLLTSRCCHHTHIIKLLKHGLAIAALCEPRERERENRCVSQINEISKYRPYAMGTESFLHQGGDVHLEFGPELC